MATTKLKDIGYYPKFIFRELNNDNFCIATTDVEMMKFVKSNKSGKSIESLEIGDFINFESDADVVFQISNIRIKYIYDDFSYFKTGIDSNDCFEIQGENKETLLKIYIDLVRI